MRTFINYTEYSDHPLRGPFAVGRPQYFVYVFGQQFPEEIFHIKVWAPKESLRRAKTNKLRHFFSAITGIVLNCT